MTDRLRGAGLGGYLFMFMLYPIFQMSIAALVYTTRPDLLRYAVVATAASSFLFNSIFYVGELLDGERMGGTLPGLFLAPCSRYSWLGGFQLVGLVETLFIVAVALTFGRYAYGVRYVPDYPALLVSLALFLASLWGLGMIFGAIGLLIKKANQLSNLIYPFAILLGGVLYPVALLPDWLRIPARALPLGYGIQALADATLYGKGIAELRSQLLPLAGFALALPLLGMLAFRWLEVVVRERGELDLY
jgi:ABC-2 type transport system permease protein